MTVTIDTCLRATLLDRKCPLEMSPIGEPISNPLIDWMQENMPGEVWAHTTKYPEEMPTP